MQSILAVDLAQPMLDALEQKHPPPATAETLGVGGLTCIGSLALSKPVAGSTQPRASSLQQWLSGHWHAVMQCAA